ncbi:MAG: hypothetical protein ABIP94_03060 [Planctomycetota bacterium]
MRVRVQAVYAGELRDAAELIAQLDYLLFEAARELHDIGAKSLDPQYAALIADVGHLRGKAVEGMHAYPIYPRVPVLIVEAQQARRDRIIDQPRAPDRDKQAAWLKQHYDARVEKQRQEAADREECQRRDAAERAEAKPAKAKPAKARRAKR